MTPEERAAARVRCEAATPGRWATEGPGPYVHSVTADAGEFTVASFCSPSDARFIAHARSDVPALLAELDQLSELLNNTAEALRLCMKDLQEPDSRPVIFAPGDAPYDVLVDYDEWAERQ